jgi:uncharacterized protein YdeI (YjbR/CyaY-like superfamily)
MGFPACRLEKSRKRAMAGDLYLIYNALSKYLDLKIGKTFYASGRKAWRAWLSRHYVKEREIWLVFPKKSEGRPRISYNDAVEEALCFGWIDSTVKSLGKERFAQRFSPRNPKTPYSQANKERLRELVARGKVIPSVLKTLEPHLSEKYVMPEDIIKRIKTDKLAWKNYVKFPEPYKRIRLAFIDGARNRTQEYEKRLGYFIKMTSKNRQFGYGGIEKYYKPRAG